MKHYEIFISYRRSSYETANLIATRLKSAGYSVFFDMETLRSGKFNEQLFEVIDNCKDFILVLPPMALDRCVQEDDWVRMETLRAMRAGKNIVPVMLNGFVWPDPMPAGMEELAYYQALTASSVEYFDMSMERLQKKYLTSQRHLPIKRIVKIAGIVLATLSIVLAILLGVFAVLSRDVCTKYATNIAKDAGYVHLLAEENHDLRNSWNRFNELLNYESNKERISDAQTDMLDRVDLAEKNLKQFWLADSVKLEISDYHSFLLSLQGVNAEEMAMSPVIATLYYKDYLDQLETIRDAVRNPTTMNRRFVTILFDVNDHSTNGYYASVLSELSSFPKKSLVVFNELSRRWKYYPAYSFNESREYYENQIVIESELAEDLLSRYGADLEQRDADIEELYRMNEELDARLEDELKDELKNLDDQLAEIHKGMKVSCSLTDEDDQWYRWGKIRRWGSFISMLEDTQEEYVADGITYEFTVTPGLVYRDLSDQLQKYQTYHPESGPYVASSRQFYLEVSQGKREYSGVIIYAFIEGHKHPFFEIGDIVTGYDGEKIKSYEGFKEAYKKNQTGAVTYLRLEDGAFKEHTDPIDDTDIIGFLDLTEELPE